MKRFALLFLLLPSENCTPMGLRDIQFGEKVETLNHANEMECSKKKFMFNPQLESQKKDWQSMIQSYNLFIGYTDEMKEKINDEQLENEVQLSNLKPMDDVGETLIMCHNYLIHIFGVPGKSYQDSLGTNSDPFKRLKQDEVQYNRSIYKLVLGLETPMQMPKPLHHVQMAVNNCVLQTLGYIRRYNLAPAVVAKEINSLYKSRSGIEWLAKTSIQIFRKDTMFHNAYHVRPFEEVQLKNHFQLTNFHELYQTLSKSEQDWWIFQYLAARMNARAEKAISEDEVCPRGFFKPMCTLIQFSIKLKKFLLNEMEHSSLDSGTTLLKDMKDDVLRMVRFIIEPNLETGMKLFDLKVIAGNTFATLDFIMVRFGSGYKEPAQLVADDKDAVEFGEKMKLLRLTTNIFIWKSMVFDYDHYVLKFEDKNHKIPVNNKECTSNFYWTNLMENIASYKRTRHVQMNKYPNWKEKMQKNIYYKHIIEMYDQECKELEAQYNDFQVSHY